MASLDEARARLEAALGRLEAALASRARMPSGSEEDGGEELEHLRRRCAALDAELERAGRTNQRLRDALAEAVARLEDAAARVDELSGSR